MLQWAREVRRFIEGETILNCWVKAEILPVLHANDLKGEGEIKAKGGAAKFKTDFEELGRELSSLALTDNTNVDDIIHPECKNFDNSNPLGIVDEEESESRMEVDNEKNEQNDKLDDNADDELVQISLTKAKEYATALHHFVVDNMGQTTELFELSEASYKMAQAVNHMVDSSTKQQRMVYD